MVLREVAGTQGSWPSADLTSGLATARCGPTCSWPTWGRSGEDRWGRLTHAIGSFRGDPNLRRSADVSGPQVVPGARGGPRTSSWPNPSTPSSNVGQAGCCVCSTERVAASKSCAAASSPPSREPGFRSRGFEVMKSAPTDADSSFARQALTERQPSPAIAGGGCVAFRLWRDAPTRARRRLRWSVATPPTHPPPATQFTAWMPLTARGTPKSELEHRRSNPITDRGDPLQDVALTCCRRQRAGMDDGDELLTGGDRYATRGRSPVRASLRRVGRGHDHASAPLRNEPRAAGSVGR